MKIPNMYSLLILVVISLVISAAAQTAPPAPAPAPNSANGSLSVNYYATICPNLESIVRGAVMQMMSVTPITGPATLRLFFHDCFVTGCDASIMINTPSGNERENTHNQFLREDGYKTVVQAKAAVDADPLCANKVSCADILALAARDSVALSGGPTWPVELGRYDALVSRSSDVDLPADTDDVPTLMGRFSAHGLSLTDLVALSGGHTLGVSSCFFINNRIYPSGDQYLDPGFVSELQSQCPQSMNPNIFVPFDQSLITFDNNYFLRLQQKKGLLFSDSALYVDAGSQGIVDRFAADQNAFFSAFVNSMVTLGRLGLKTAANGEIRKDCQVAN